MAVSAGYREYVLEQLEGLGPVTAKRMFGGVGLYADGLFFGILDDDLLYLKVDEVNRPAFEERGCAPFTPIPGKNSMNYMAVPEDVIEDPSELVDWARGAVAAAMRKK
jgi:DNA transformation protein and related proteins